MRILIADDEPLARRVLRQHLVESGCDDEIYDARDGISAMRMVDELQPDLLFVDIRMPGASGLDVVQQAAHRPHIIFTTAYDRFAVTAFEIGALDYLLKPFGRERLLKAVARAKAAMKLGLPSNVARATEALDAPKPIEHFFVRERDRIRKIPVSAIERLESCDDYVALCTSTGRHLLYARMYDVLARLDQHDFLRVHRSHAVNLSHVEALVPRPDSRVDVVMASGARVPSSRAGAARIRKLFRVR